MNTYPAIVENIEKLMNQTLKSLQEMNHENFETNLRSACTTLDYARKLRSSMQEERISAELQNRLKKVNLTAKLIEKEYDNIVENQKAEVDKLALAIQNIGREKKIAIYTRG